METVQTGLNALSPHLRAICILVDIQGLDYAQAADILGISISDVSTCLAKARMQLGKCLVLP